jgi:hypothetical protein
VALSDYPSIKQPGQQPQIRWSPMTLMQKLFPPLRDWPIMAVFSQASFNRQMNRKFKRSSWIAWLANAFMGLFLIATLFHAATTLVPGYLTLRELAATGLEASGTATEVTVTPYTTGKSNTQMYKTELSYTYAAKDGSRFAAKSIAHTHVKPILTKGARVAVVYDAAKPARNATRLALESEQKDMVATLYYYLFMWPVLAIQFMRYRAWRNRW